MILRDCRKRHANLGMTWIDYKKAYMVPHSWILEIFELVQASDNILEFVERSMANWQTGLISSGGLEKVIIMRRIFHCGSLSPSLFVICVIPLTHVLSKAMTKYTLGGKGKINHLLFMDDLKYGLNVWNE